MGTRDWSLESEMARGVSHAYLVTGCHVTTIEVFHNVLVLRAPKMTLSEKYPLLVSYPILDA